ncbi:hypothetical protein DOT_1565 [Desulfosporosinus sp. OT]|nr:hypothetical protein DOT_1565 [Desulfosporosinus sp. OT]
MGQESSKTADEPVLIFGGSIKQKFFEDRYPKLSLRLN